MSMNNEELILAEYAECGIYEDLDSSYDGNESVGFKDFSPSQGKQVNGHTQKAATDIKKVPSCRELRRHSDSNHGRPLEDSQPNAEIVAVWQKRLSKEASIPDIVDEDPNIVIVTDDESENDNVDRKSNCVLNFDATAAEEIEDDEDRSLIGDNEIDNNENNPEVSDETRSCSHSDDHHDLRIQPTIEVDTEREETEREEVERAYDFDEFDCEEPEVENIENVPPNTTDDQFLEKEESSCEVLKRVRCGSIGTARTDVEDSTEWEGREAGRGVRIDLGKVKATPPYCEYNGDSVCCIPYDDCTGAGTGRSDEGSETTSDEKTERPVEMTHPTIENHSQNNGQRERESQKKILLPLYVAPERKHDSAVKGIVSFLKSDPCPCPPLGTRTRNPSILRGQTDGPVRNILKPKKQVLPMRVQKQNSQDMAAKLLKSRVDAAVMKKRQILRKLSIGESDTESQTNDGCYKDKDRERRRIASQNNNCLIPMGCYERRSREVPRDGASESRVQDPSRGSQSPNRSLSLINPTSLIVGPSVPAHASRPTQYPALSPARASLSPVRASAPHSQVNSAGGTCVGSGAGAGFKPAQGWGHGPGQGRPERERYCVSSLWHGECNSSIFTNSAPAFCYNVRYSIIIHFIELLH
jgi:hypothetical protein